MAQFNIEIKNPDAIYWLVQENSDLSQDDISFVEKYFKYGEYITIQFDTDKKTVTVLKA